MYYIFLVNNTIWLFQLKGLMFHVLKTLQIQKKIGLKCGLQYIT